MVRTIDVRMKGLSRAVKNEARAESEMILAEAQEKASLIIKEAHQKYDQENLILIEKAEKEAEKIKAEAQASAELEVQMVWLEKREQMLQEVFKAVKKRLSEIAQREDYGEILKNLIIQSIERIGGDDFVVHADERSADLIRNDLIKSLQQETNSHIKLGDLLTDKTGIILQTADGHREYDNTFENRLKQREEILRPLVFHTLMGEVQ